MPQICASRLGLTHSSKDTAQFCARRGGSGVAPSRWIEKRGVQYGADITKLTLSEQIRKKLVPAALKDRFVLGSPEECYEQLRPYWERLGVNHLVIRTHWAGMPLSTGLHSTRLISNELIPALRKV